MTESELRVTFPEWTIYLFEEEGKIKNLHTSEYYVQRGKNYKQCTEAINKQNPKKWREKQDKDLYQVASILEIERNLHQEIFQSDFGIAENDGQLWLRAIDRNGIMVGRKYKRENENDAREAARNYWTNPDFLCVDVFYVQDGKLTVLYHGYRQ